MLDGNQSPTRRDLWMVRMYYFTMVGGGGFVGPFLNIFLASQGLDGVKIGLVTAIGSVVGLIAAPLWTRFSAQHRQPLRLLQAALILFALVTIVLSSQSVFFWLSFFYAFRILVGAGISPISDSMALHVTEALQTGFGSVRVWGSFGWAVIVLFTGWLNQNTSLRSGFYGFGIAMAASALLLTQVRASPAAAPRFARLAAVSLRDAAQRIWHNRPLIGLGIMLVIIGLANTGVAQFENIYLTQLGAGAGLVGVASMVSSVVEIPGMLYADRMVRRHNPARILVVALSLNCVLRAAVFLFPGVATIIAAKAAGGIAFSFYTVALIKYVGERTLPHETATALAIFTVTLPGLISISAAPISGYFFDLAGARWLYAAASLGYILGGLALRAAQPALIQTGKKISEI